MRTEAVSAAPTRDELARDELNHLGLLYFVDVRATARQLLDGMGRAQRTAFAATVAERLIREHHATDPVGATPVVRAFRTGMDAVWRGLAHDDHAPEEVRLAVADFYHGRYPGDREREDPADASTHTMMAALYACECSIHGCLEFALWSGWRGFDVATVRTAHDRTWPHRRPAEISGYAWELAHPTVQSELGQQLEDLELIDSSAELLLGQADPRRLLDQLRDG
jgi:hypothetical protein